METKEMIDRGWASSKEKILFIIYLFTPLWILFFTAWLLRSMPNSMMKAVLIFIPFLVSMLMEAIILSFFWVD